MKFQKLVFLFLIVASCGSSFDSPRNSNKLFTPTGTIEISENLFYDKHKISNLDWKEYVYWIKNVHGINSKEYQSALPDTSVWSQLRYGDVYVENYFQHQAFSHYPVVGINVDQMQRYSLWRSNRVNELRLAEAGLMDFDTIGKVEFLTFIQEHRERFQDVQFMLYALPSHQEYKEAKKYSDSIVSIEEQKSKCQRCLENEKAKGESLKNYKRSGHVKSFDQDLYEPQLIFMPCIKEKISVVHYLPGNTLEQLNDQVIGDVSSKIKESLVERQSLNFYTTFRNTCSWVSLEEYIKTHNQ